MLIYYIPLSLFRSDYPSVDQSMDIKSPYPPPYPEVGFSAPRKRNNKEYRLYRFTITHLIVAIVATFVITSAGFLIYVHYMRSKDGIHRHIRNSRCQSFSSATICAASHSLASNVWLNSIICAISIAFLMSRSI